MTRPLFFAPPQAVRSALPGDSFVLDGEEGRHAATVRRLGPGEQIEVSDGAGHRISGSVATVGAGTLELVVETADLDPAPRHRLVLVQALAKGGRDEQAVEAATELGVDCIVPWHAERSIVRWRDERAEKGRRKWQSLVEAASKQSRRSFVPGVHPVLDTRGLIRQAASLDRVIVLHEEATEPLAQVWSAFEDSVQLDHTSTAVIVGPEGGIGAAELDVLLAAGARPACLGRNVLRSSSAGPAALVLLNHLLGRW
ncbi:16S rRNA (uracil(1498)-N(3))-methyltransferase [Arthrobacter echini]|uniref:Ribosomal RNA small subunit methyltransferase E n=1 Tax=Arthrobacter echini TaxID=1529066 RepID=A0A4S5E6D1_9MICC|nr:16S rRNA (uracil(1498)-N(3))-methyltransferase [Arthrobacter echini]THJ67094.1 16S rRNA (uracil(1498)-N(3))-methyltransferase [Arthrobacter echini]